MSATLSPPAIPQQSPAAFGGFPLLRRAAVLGAGTMGSRIAAHLANSQLPLNHVAFEAPVDVAAWHDKPTFYVISTKDKVLAPEAQKSFAARMKAQTTEVAGSHSSLVVHAKQVAEVIEKAALAK